MHLNVVAAVRCLSSLCVCVKEKEKNDRDKIANERTKSNRCTECRMKTGMRVESRQTYLGRLAVTDIRECEERRMEVCRTDIQLKIGIRAGRSLAAIQESVLIVVSVLVHSSQVWFDSIWRIHTLGFVLLLWPMIWFACQKQQNTTEINEEQSHVESLEKMDSMNKIWLEQREDWIFIKREQSVSRRNIRLTSPSCH